MERILTPQQFERLSNLISTHWGIKMPPSKRLMLSGRVVKRVRALGMASLQEYCDYLFDHLDGDEIAHLCDAVTTNKTDFFREKQHFDYMQAELLPLYAQSFQASARSPFRIWSAGCSSGEEPYTLAMVVQDYKERTGWPASYEIVATDIDQQMLNHGIKGIYRREKVEPVPRHLQQRYLRRSRKRPELVRVAPDLRSKVRFGYLNLMDETYPLPKPVHMIFCRNVIIYFEKQTQHELALRFSQVIDRGGYLFLGHSESFFGQDLPFKQIKPTVYQRL